MLLTDETIKHSTHSLKRKRGPGTLIVLILLSACILIPAGVLVACSPGKPKPFVDKYGQPLKGSISEKIHIDINGFRQGMFIMSKDSTKPVLLLLHGGMPEYFLTKKYPTGLEEHFTVIWWEQRGSGISYSDSIPPETLTLEQMIADVLAITKYLCLRFGKDKIYIMGHSGGSFIGIQAAARAPELFHAYIGVAQISNQLKSEELAYNYMLQKYKESGNNKMVRKLEATPVSMNEGTPAKYLALRDMAMHSLGIGTTHRMHSVLTGIFLASLTCRDYTLLEKVTMWRGKSRSGVSCLWNTMLTTDLSLQVSGLAVPVYFFEGIFDYTCSYAEAKSYFNILKAPVKGFYTFKESAHSPHLEEPSKMREIMLKDVLAGTNSLADKD
jgi:pimeloyl-ACP methyl ester carboxylesterase